MFSSGHLHKRGKVPVQTCECHGIWHGDELLSGKYIGFTFDSVFTSWHPDWSKATLPSIWLWWWWWGALWWWGGWHVWEERWTTQKKVRKCMFRMVLTGNNWQVPHWHGWSPWGAWRAPTTCFPHGRVLLPSPLVDINSSLFFRSRMRITSWGAKLLSWRNESLI